MVSLVENQTVQGELLTHKEQLRQQVDLRSIEHPPSTYILTFTHQLSTDYFYPALMIFLRTTT